MSRTKEQIIEDIRSKIGANGKQSITGNKLQKLLVDMVTDLSTTNEENIKFETKQDVLVNEVNIKSLGGTSMLGQGNIPVDSTVTKNSTNIVTSGAVYEAIKNISPTPGPTPTPAEIPVLYICDDDQTTGEEAAHNLDVLDQLIEQTSDYRGQINIPVKLVFRWDYDAGDGNEELIEYKADGNILALEKKSQSSPDIYTYYLEVEYKSCNYDEPTVLERTIHLATDNNEQDGDNGRLFYYYPGLQDDTYILNHPINIPLAILGKAEEPEGEEVVVDMSWSIITKNFHILSYDIVNEYMQEGIIPQYSIGVGVLSYNFGTGQGKPADGDLYNAGYYQVFFDFNDKVIRLRVYDNDHVTTLRESKQSSSNTNVVIYELWNEKNVSLDVFQSVQSTPTRGEDVNEGTILEGDPEHLYHESWFNESNTEINNNMLTEAITNFLSGKTVILYDSTSDGLHMKVIAAASLEEPVRGGNSTSPRQWAHNSSVGLVCINPYNMKKVVWTYIVQIDDIPLAQ